MSEDKSLDYKKRFSSELTTLPVFRDDQLWNNGDLGIGPDLQVSDVQQISPSLTFHVASLRTRRTGNSIVALLTCCFYLFSFTNHQHPPPHPHETQLNRQLKLLSHRIFWHRTKRTRACTDRVQTALAMGVYISKVTIDQELRQLSFANTK